MIVDRVNDGRYERLVRRIAEWTEGEIAVVCPRQTRHVAQVVVAGADPVYPSFAPTTPMPKTEGAARKPFPDALLAQLGEALAAASTIHFWRSIAKLP